MNSFSFDKHLLIQMKGMQSTKVGICVDISCSEITVDYFECYY